MKKRIIFPFIMVVLCCFAGSDSVRAAEETPAFFKNKTADVPIIMYHLVTKNGRYVGKHGITPAELESDLKYLKDNDYQTVIMADLAAFVLKGKKLPEKPIVLTFDDGNSSDYRYLYPLLQKYDMKAVVSVLGHAIDECTTLASKQKEPAVFPNLTWQQLKEMNESQFVELQCHSYNLHSNGGSGQRRGESEEAYHKRLHEDLAKNHQRIEEMTGAKPMTFTYPYGIISDSSKKVLDEMGITATLSCQSGLNHLQEDDPDCLYRLKRSNRPSGVPVYTLLQKMQ